MCKLFKVKQKIKGRNECILKFGVKVASELTLLLNSKYSIQKGSNANADIEESDNDSACGGSVDDQRKVPH